MPVLFFNADVKFNLPLRLAFKKFIAESFESVTGKKLSVSYIFCSDEYLLRINKNFLKHDYYTDIITFPLAETDKKVEAEIYISIDRISDNAQKHKVAFEQEIQRVIFHGALHLAGYKDNTTTQKKLMRLMEDEWITAFERKIKSGK